MKRTFFAMITFLSVETFAQNAIPTRTTTTTGNPTSTGGKMVKPSGPSKTTPVAPVKPKQQSRPGATVGTNGTISSTQSNTINNGVRTGSTTTQGNSTTNTNSPSNSGGVGNVVNDIINGVTGGTTTGGGLNGVTQTDAASAIKQLLITGITAGVKQVAVKDGYLGNSLIKIPFPEEAAMVQNTLAMVGASGLTDKLTTQINRAAEDAATEAGPIFLNSITQMNVTDAINIVGNQQSDAATQFLQRTTTDQLVTAFRPKIKAVLDKTMTTTLWSEIMGTYNKVPFVQKINPDLTDYVTRQGLNGLFKIVAQEEGKIRKNPTGTASDIIHKVFGAALKK